MGRPQVALTHSTEHDVPRLTNRELSILELAAYGHSNDEIAHELYLSRQTVAHRLSDAFRKLQARTRADAIARAYVFGLLEPFTWPPRLTGRTHVD